MFDLRSIDDRRRAIAQSTPKKHKSALGQYMTQSVVAGFIAGMFNPLIGKNIRLLDAGAGIGSLCAAFAERASYECAGSLECEAWEIDPRLHEPLAETLSACGESMATHGTRFSGVILPNDFILAAAGHFHRENSPAHTHTHTHTHAILNPPYKKSVRRLRIDTRCAIVASKHRTSTPPSSRLRSSLWKTMESWWRSHPVVAATAPTFARSGT